MDRSGGEGTHRPKVFGIGLNKTGTKTLGRYLTRLGYRNRSWDSPTAYTSPSFDLWKAGRIEDLLAIMEEYDSGEDWPWPLLYRELDERFPDARFVLTVRESSETWFRSLCNMAVRIGPLPLYEKHVYGDAMPQGRKEQHIQVYEAHNRAVREYFRDRPGKLLELCWEKGDTGEDLARFLGLEHVELEETRVNTSPSSVYSGNNRLLAIFHRVLYQRFTGPHSTVRQLAGRLGGRGG